MHRRQFLGGAALAALLPLVGGGAAATAAASSAATQARLLPRPVHPGDTIGLVSPSAAVDAQSATSSRAPIMPERPGGSGAVPGAGAPRPGRGRRRAPT